MVFLNFLNFFPFFLEFSITCLVRTKQNDNFYFLHFASFSNLLWLEMNPSWYFLIFRIFFSFFSIFYYASERNGTERKFLFYLIHILFQPIFARNVAILVFFLCVEFLGYFFEILYYALGRNETKRKFYFYLSHTFPTYFGLK